SSGSAYLPVSTLAIGTHTITAVYSGDTDVLPGTSSAVAQVVRWGDGITGLSILTAPTMVYGQPIRATVSISRAGNAPITLNPAGTINLLDGSALTSPKVASGTLVTQAGVTTATLVGPTLSVGIHPQFTASYPGNTSFVPTLMTSAVPITVT